MEKGVENRFDAIQKKSKVAESLLRCVQRWDTTGENRKGVRALEEPDTAEQAKELGPQKAQAAPSLFSVF